MIWFIVVAAILMSIQYVGWIYAREARPDYLAFQNLELLSQNMDLCPGDTLQWEVDVSSRIPVMIQRGAQTWSLDVDRKISSTEFSYFILLGPSDYKEVDVEWTIPNLVPGEYERRIALVLPGLAASHIAYGIPFSVRANCDE